MEEMGKERQAEVRARDKFSQAGILHAGVKLNRGQAKGPVIKI